MLRHFRQWRAARAARRENERDLPERVRAAIVREQIESERLISGFQLGVVLFFALLAALQPPQPPTIFEGDQPVIHPVVAVLVAYAAFALARLYLAWRERLVPWLLYLSVVADMALLLGLIWTFHIEYAQPPSFYLKVPTLLYVFIFIGLRVLSFQDRYVIAAGAAAAGGWAVLVAYAILDPEGGGGGITRDYVLYMTSNSILIGAEMDKIITILVVTVILAAAMRRARRLVVRSATEGAAARDLARFFSPEVAERITASEQAIRAGSGEQRDAAIVFCDIRGFTRYSHTVPPDEVIAMLTGYQQALVPVLQAHGGTIDKFLGDGIMATFGAVAPSPTAAADALRAVAALIEASEAWSRARAAAGQPGLRVNAGVAYGPIVFGAVGDHERLEYTVIGDPVNQAAKLEKANKVERVAALTDRATFEAACDQGYAGEAVEHRHGSRLEGFDEAVDLVVLAAGASSSEGEPGAAADG